MSSERAARGASEALDALGDANRRAIVQILSGGGRSVQEIADELPISRPAVSRHLRLLKGAGLVEDRPDGTRHIYELQGDGVQAIRSYFEAVWDNAATAVPHRGRETPTGAAAMSDDPLVVEFEVGVPPAEAFDVWTRRCAVWWPPSHTVSGDPSAITFESRAGVGSWSRGRDGAEHDWGAGAGLRPPTRVRYLLAPVASRPRRRPRWSSRSPPCTAGAAVRLEQRGWEKLGDAGLPRLAADGAGVGTS